MPSASELAGGQSQMEAALDSGIEQISAKQKVQFTRYTKFVLSQDGFVFWVATGETMTATGALHYSTEAYQDEDQTIGANQVLFTSESEVTQFNEVSPQSMWIGSWPLDGEQPALKVAFSQRGNYFPEADIWHYSGFAVFPAMESQIISSPDDLPTGPIVSNSLPIWLSTGVFNGNIVPVYPSFLVPDNISPPYIVAHIHPEMTEALAAAPYIGPWPGTTIPNSGASPLHQLAGSQLMRDHVKLTLYGFDNDLAWQYFTSLYEGSMNEILPFGFGNSPALQDEKRIQSEIMAIAQKKTLHIIANYDQGSADAVARRLILSAMISKWTILGGIQTRAQGDVMTQPMTVNASGQVYE